MQKILISFTAALILVVNCFSQTERENANAGGQAVYSESVPYVPRIFLEKKKDKKKSEKKKQDDQIKTSAESAATPVNVPGATDSSDSNNLQIPVSVVDQNDVPVTDLNKSDFQLFLNDRESEITNFKKADDSLNVFLVLDASASIAFKDNNYLKTVANAFISTLPPQARIQIVQFDDKVKILNELTSDRQILAQAATKKLKPGEGTSLYDALDFVLKKMAAVTDGQNIIIIVSDGIDTTSNKFKYETSLLEAHNFAAFIYPFYFDTLKAYGDYQKKLSISSVMIGQILGNRLNKNFNPEAEAELGRNYLFDLAWLTGGKTFILKNISKIDQAQLQSLSPILPPQYYLQFDPSKLNEPAGSRLMVKIRIKRPNLKIRSRSGVIIIKKGD